MPEAESTNLVACDSLGEARELSARIRARLPVRASQDAAQRTDSASRRLAIPEGPGSAQLAALHARLDRLEQALASAGTFA
jgi:hypothetical protein